MAPPDEAGSERQTGTALDHLVHRCAAGDGDAFRTLYETLSARLYGLAMRLLREPQLASDAVHDTFLQVWKESRRFDVARGHAESWIVSLLRYRSLDIVRRRRREVVGDPSIEAADLAPDALRALMSGEEGEALQRCLDELEAGQRQLVVLSFIDGLSHAELALTLHRPLGTVKSLMRRTLLGLRRCLES